MARHPGGPDEPALFDLPLQGGERPPVQPEPEKPAVVALNEVAEDVVSPQPVELFAVPDLGELDAEVLDVVESAESGEPQIAKAAPRMLAGVFDVGVISAVLAAAWLGSAFMGSRPGAADWPALATFVASFSFLYQVLPLAFWGRTWGMSISGLTARTPERQPLTFGQAARRWAGSVTTVLALGLPALTLLLGVSFVDRLSGTVTLSDPAGQ